MMSQKTEKKSTTQFIAYHSAFFWSLEGTIVSLSGRSLWPFLFENGTLDGRAGKNGVVCGEYVYVCDDRWVIF